MPTVVRSVVLGVLAATHSAAALGVLVLLPRGFPVLHPRFFSNQALPVALLVASLGCGVLLVYKPHLAVKSSVVYPALWFGFAISCAGVFPETGRSAVLFAGGLGVACAIGWGTCVRFSSVRVPEVALFATLAGLAGAALPFCVRAPAAQTVPFEHRPFTNSSSPNAHSINQHAFRPEAIALRSNLQVDPRTRRVEWTHGKLQFAIRPLLEFHSRSPDGFLTIFGPRPPNSPALLPMPDDGGLTLSDEGGAVALRLEAPSEKELHMDGFVQLDIPVHSHLNSYTTVTATGHSRLGLRFSPCPDAIIDVVHADYPFGAPARFAYLDGTGEFNVVQAADAEKGPFTTLATGRLERDAPLTVTLVELGAGLPQPLAAIELEDWAHQLSTALSPTAGFGVPQNAIEFGLTSPNVSSTAYMIWTLAATSVGRGWDTVTHAPGFYRNRMHVRVSD